MTSMTYNNSYDVAAVMLCICCIFYFVMSKRIRHFKHTLYAMRYNGGVIRCDSALRFH